MEALVLSVLGVVVGAAALGLAFYALQTGWVLRKDWFGGMRWVHRSEEPLAYWGMLAFFFVLGAATLVFAVFYVIGRYGQP